MTYRPARDDPPGGLSYKEILISWIVTIGLLALTSLSVAGYDLLFGSPCPPPEAVAISTADTASRDAQRPPLLGAFETAADRAAFVADVMDDSGEESTGAPPPTRSAIQQAQTCAWSIGAGTYRKPPG